ncbi:MAG: hypothetical protein R2873_03385 [Caldilineaceae bacterium]
MHNAGFLYPGHTELLAERTGAGADLVLLVGPSLRVVHAGHPRIWPKRSGALRVLEVIGLACQSMRTGSMHHASPCRLNPRQ